MNNLFNALNTSPVPTYRWLGVNHCDLEGKHLPVLAQHVKRVISNEEAIKINTRAGLYQNEHLDSTAPMGESFKDYIDNHANESLEIIIDTVIDDPIIFNYDLENETLAEQTTITFDEDASATLVFVYRGEGSHLGIKEIVSKRGSKGKIIKINLLKGDSLEMQETVVSSQANSNIEIVHLNIGEDVILDNINVSLDENATGAIDAIYLGANKNLLDLNYVMAHKGRRSESTMYVKGALLDQAEKTFRGTIDFKRGASGSKGKEEEYVLLLSKDVRNKALPLILCHEDDVSGEHAASCGRIDEDKLFYLMSRGFSYEESKKMIIEGNFNPVLDKIPDETLVEEVQEVIKRRLL